MTDACRKGSRPAKATAQVLENITVKKRRPQSVGQAVLEYVLIVAISSLVFGAVFGVIRRQLFQMWVCEIGPRVQSATPCRDRADCFQKLQEQTNGLFVVPPDCRP